MQETEQRKAAEQEQKGSDTATAGKAKTAAGTAADNVNAANNAKTAADTVNASEKRNGAEFTGNTGRTGRTNAAAERWGSSVGENGQKAYNANIREDTDLDMYTKGFARYYDLGLAGVPFDTVRHTGVEPDMPCNPKNHHPFESLSL